MHKHAYFLCVMSKFHKAFLRLLVVVLYKSKFGPFDFVSIAMTLAHDLKASCIDATVSLLKGCLGCLMLPTGCAGLPNQQAAPGSWPASDAAHQAAMADGAQGGSMRDDMVPVTPPGDASRSAGLPDQAGGGPQAGQGPQAGLPQGNLVPNTSMPYVTSGGGQHLLHQVERKGDWWASATAVTAEQGDMAADGMGAMHRQSSASPSGGPAASAGVLFDAGSWFILSLIHI